MRLSRRSLIRTVSGYAALLLGACTPPALLSAKPTEPPAAVPRAARPEPPPPPTVAPAAQIADDPGFEMFEIGRSVRGRPIEAIRLGLGEVAVAFIGNIHGGWEPRAREVIHVGLEYFQKNLSEIPAGSMLYFLPTVNPDGYEAGRPLWARADGKGGPGDAALAPTAFNARGVDLNRNFDAEWIADACGGERVRLVDNPGCFDPVCNRGCRKGLGGPRPFSEPETQAYRDFILGRKVRLALTYHEHGFAAIGIRNGGGGASEPFAIALAERLRCDYIASWLDPPLTGHAQQWLDANGMLGAEVELRYRGFEPLDEPTQIGGMKLAIDWALTH